MSSVNKICYHSDDLNQQFKKFSWFSLGQQYKHFKTISTESALADIYQ